MGKLRKLRSRFISSVSAVKRSILRMQSTNYSTSALTTPGGDDDEELPPGLKTTQAGIGSQRNMGLSIWRKMETPEEDATKSGRQLKLHWSDGRRIYSEPTQTVDGLVSGGDRPGNCSSNGHCNRIERKSGEAFGNDVTNATSLASGSSVLAAEAPCSISSDDEDNDDVFVDSWEDHQRERGRFKFECSQ